MRLSALLSLAASGLFFACGGSHSGSEAPQGGCPQGYAWNGQQCVPMASGCPAGTVWNGAQCAQGTSCPAGTVWTGTQCSATGSGGAPGTGGAGGMAAAGGTGGTAGGGQATPLDPTAATAAAAVLDAATRASVPSGAKAVGAPLAGQFGEGQTMTLAVPMQAGRCYTFVAQGTPPISEVDLELAPVLPVAIPIPGIPSPVLAQDGMSGALASIGAAPNDCYHALVPGSMTLTVRARAGSGVIVARVYEK